MQHDWFFAPWLRLFESPRAAVLTHTFDVVDAGRRARHGSPQGVIKHHPLLPLENHSKPPQRRALSVLRHIHPLHWQALGKGCRRTRRGNRRFHRVGESAAQAKRLRGGEGRRPLPPRGEKTYSVFEGALAAPWGVRQLAASSTPLGGSLIGRVHAPVFRGAGVFDASFFFPLGGTFKKCPRNPQRGARKLQVYYREDIQGAAPRR